MHAHVVARSVYPIDGVNWHIDCLAAVANSEALGKGAPRCHGFRDSALERQLATGKFADEFQQLGPVLEGELFVARLASALDGLCKPLVVDRFQQVIQRIRFEGFQREFVVGRNENDDRHVAAGQTAQHLETVDARHLYVEKDNVGRLFTYGVDRLAAIAALAADFHVIKLLQPDLQTAPRQWFIVNDQCFQHRRSRREC